MKMIEKIQKLRAEHLTAGGIAEAILFNTEDFEALKDEATALLKPSKSKQKAVRQTVFNMEVFTSKNFTKGKAVIGDRQTVSELEKLLNS